MTAYLCISLLPARRQQPRPPSRRSSRKPPRRQTLPPDAAKAGAAAVAPDVGAGAGASAAEAVLTRDEATNTAATAAARILPLALSCLAIDRLCLDEGGAEAAENNEASINLLPLLLPVSMDGQRAQEVISSCACAGRRRPPAGSWWRTGGRPAVAYLRSGASGS
jgi:hypothetical protein